MQRASLGYTVIEVMIFLAISAGLLIAAVNLISGRQGQVEFDQKVRDTQSKVDDVINDVATGFTGGDNSQLKCSAPGGSRPKIFSTGGPNPTPECIFLGKAIQFTDKADSPYQDKLFIYSVFGSRLDSSGELATNLYDTQPVAATGSGGGGGAGNADLTVDFNLAPLQVKSVTSSAIGSPYNSSHLIGFFNSFNTEQSTSANGGTDVNSYLFRYAPGNPVPGDLAGGGELRSCLELQNATACFPLGTDETNWPEKLQNLKACLSDGKHSALLTISSNGGIGASTKLDYVAC